MTQEDLMVNDWYYDCGYKRNCQWYLSDYTEMDANMIEPIYLTEEILFANGFKKCDYKDYILNLEHEDYIAVSLISGEKVVDIKHEYNMPIGNDLYINCYYVHELQHALRLCGLNDLADNFKLKED